MAKKSNQKLGSGCLVLFALPFAGIGVFMAVLVARTLWDWNVVQDWVQTPATILEASLEEHRGDDSTSYEAVARYAYQYAGKRHEGTRVALTGGSDNIGSFQRDKAAEIKRFKQNGKPFRCFVNSDDPTEAVLYRDLRIGMFMMKAMIGLLFGGVGFGLIGATFWVRKRRGREEKHQQSQPDQPWLWREDWARGVVRSTRWKPVIVMGVFALFWNAISWTVGGLFLFGGKDFPLWVSAICLGFPAIGLCMIGYTAYLIARASRWGASEFELATLPGTIGGRLAGVIHAPAGLTGAESFLLTLTCFEKKTRTTSDGTETYQEPVWQADKTIVRTLAADRTNKTVIPVSFYVPYDCHPTDQTAGYSWKLQAQAEVPGIDFLADFEVPVFKTSESSRDPPPDDELLTEYEAPETFEAALARSKGRVLSQTPSRCEVVFPMARNLGLAFGATVFAAMWTGISIGLLYSDAPLIFRIVFPASDLLILWMVAWFWLESVSLSFGRDGLEVQGGILGLGKRYRFERDEIKSIVAEASGTRSGNTVYQQVALKALSGDSRKLVGGITRRADAETLATKIGETLGLADANQSRSN